MRYLQIRLIFSNCLLFNKGIHSRGIRKMAMTLRTKFEKLAAKVKGRKNWQRVRRKRGYSVTAV